ncbi:biopolymer transporter ExbD [Salipiger aestuarii]|uniref:biopolymer transporter ExbD n=1 Tax=Salipiger aestuarii TaxID=568098 RepID=UPI00025B6451|nr:biopolymer transporter ExbD [Salipiger aestuarii]EIE51281.1 hypothetical protein C357_09538 [Citreicella sp. 357]
MRRIRRRRRLSVTSLIDIIFLLLLFFMLSSTFTKFSEVELMAAGAAVASGADTPPLFLRLGADTVMLNAAELTLDDLAKALAGHKAADEDEARRLLVALRPEVTSQRLTDLLVVLRGVPGFAPTILGKS